MSRQAVDVVITPATIVANTIVGPTQVVSTGTDATTSIATLLNEIGTLNTNVTTIGTDIFATQTLANTGSTDIVALGSILIVGSTITNTMSTDLAGILANNGSIITKLAIIASDQGTLVTDVAACFSTGTIVSNNITGSSMYLTYDTTLVPDSEIMVQELNAILNFLQTNGSIAL